MNPQRPPTTTGFPVRWAAFLVISAIYIAACACPAIEFSPEAPPKDFGDLRFLPDCEAGPQFGITALALGWTSPWTIPWCANLVLFGGLILLVCKRYYGALGFGIATALLGASTWALFDYDDRLQRLLVGYYLWQASLLVLPAAAILLLLRKRDPAGAERG